MKVYDIANAGPRNCFTVRGDNGQPLIVHNCIQSLSRDIIVEHMLKIDKRYTVVGTVHDEIICVVPDAEVEEAKAFMLEVMRTAPSWLAYCPLDAEVEASDNYSGAH